MNAFSPGNLFTSKMLRKGLIFVISTIVLQLIGFALLLYEIDESDKLYAYKRTQTEFVQHVQIDDLRFVTILQPTQFSRSWIWYHVLMPSNLFWPTSSDSQL